MQRDFYAFVKLYHGMIHPELLQNYYRVISAVHTMKTNLVVILGEHHRSEFTNVKYLVGEPWWYTIGI